MTVEIDGYDIEVHPLAWKLIYDMRDELIALQRERDNYRYLIRQYYIKRLTADKMKTKPYWSLVRDARYKMFAAAQCESISTELYK